MKRKKVWVIFFLLMEKKKFAKEDMQCKKKNCGTRAHLQNYILNQMTMKLSYYFYMNLVVIKKNLK